MKLIALKHIKRFVPGDSFEEKDKIGRVLIALGKARQDVPAPARLATKAIQAEPVEASPASADLEQDASAARRNTYKRRDLRAEP